MPFSVGPMSAKGADDSAALIASAAVSAAGTVSGSAVRLPAPCNGVFFILDVTAAASAADDTLDVKIQTSFNVGGTATWLDVAVFTQVLGNGGAKRFVMKICTASAQAAYETGTALTATNVRNLFGDSWRAVHTVAAGAGTHIFTFSVTAVPF